jgi:acetyl esterase/lipase
MPLPKYLAARSATTLIALISLALCLAFAGMASPGLATAKKTKLRGAEPTQLRWNVSGSLPPKTTPQRHLIVIPGGGFTFLDKNFWPTIAPKAAAAGFTPHLLEYRLYDLEGAVADARAMARSLANRYGRDNVYAYGSSAGGTLAILLAANAQVAGSVVSSGLYDLRYWPWATVNRGPEYLASIGADREVRRRVSPMRHRLRCPALLLHGSWDPIVPVTQAEDFEALRPRARLRTYPAGHGLYKARPASVSFAINWLARTAAKQSKVAEAVKRGARTARAARRILCA